MYMIDWSLGLVFEYVGGEGRSGRQVSYRLRDCRLYVSGSSVDVLFQGKLVV